MRTIHIKQQMLPRCADEQSWQIEAPLTTLLAILISSPAQAAFVTGRSLSENKNYRLELFSDDASPTTPTQVRIDTSQIKRGHVIDLPVAARNGFSAILTPEYKTYLMEEFDNRRMEK